MDSNSLYHVGGRIKLELSQLMHKMKLIVHVLNHVEVVQLGHSILLELHVLVSQEVAWIQEKNNL